MTRSLVYIVEQYPERSQTFVSEELRELRARGWQPRVLSLYPPHDPAPDVEGVEAVLLPSAGRGPGALLRAVAHLLRRHPLRLVRAAGFVLRRPSRLQVHALSKAVLAAHLLGSEPPRRVHAHFARVSASVALMTALLTGARFSFTAHASDIFVRPFDVERKLRRAEPAVTVCEYNRRWMHERWPGVETIAIAPCGVDPERFRRTTPYRRDPFTIVAVGRLVDKKGFSTLVRACGLLAERGIDHRCRILGEGPQRGELEQLIADLDLARQVSLDGAATAAEVRAALEEASVFCLPCQVSPSGDRDSQPVVIKEAMAMEVPVLSTAEVAIPEMLDDEVGRLVPPRAVAELAAALVELAEMSQEELVAMGQRGRLRVQERFSLRAQVDALLAAWSGH
jgi:colanic acid/amylovoran biosynthesis glycosyltransferase